VDSHPLAAAGSWADDVFAIDDYFHGPVKVWESERDGIKMTFYDRPIPLSHYASAIEASGLLIERIAEPVPGDDLQSDAAARLRRVPLFLHLRAVKP
jgi:hypothetical protein